MSKEKSLEVRSFRLVWIISMIGVSARFATDLVGGSDLNLLLLSVINLATLVMSYLFFASGRERTGIAIYIMFLVVTSLYVLSRGGVQSRAPMGFVVYTMLMAVILERNIRTIAMVLYFLLGIGALVYHEFAVVKLHTGVIPETVLTKGLLYINLTVTTSILIIVMKRNFERERDELTSRNFELQEVNRSIEEQIHELSATQEQIKSMNEHLEATVRGRTLQLQQRNDMIERLAFTNAHRVRGPLARVIGLVLLAEKTSGEAQKLAELKTAAFRMDDVVRKINEVLSE